MAPRIDSAEVVSFRLKVPRLELERLPQSKEGRELGLGLAQEDGELVLALSEADSYLKFRSIGAEAMLTDVYVFRDDEGHFLHRILGPLMIRFAGDLDLRAVWNAPERNTDGNHAAVKITRGITDYRGLIPQPVAEISAGAGGGQSEVPSGHAAAASSPEEQEIRDLLEKARESFQEYLRLKNQKK